MKLYLHYDEDIQEDFGSSARGSNIDVTNLKECTFIFQFNMSDGGSKAILNYFVQEYSIKFGNAGAFGIGDVFMVNEGMVLTNEGKLRENDDVFMVVKSRVGGAAPVAPVAPFAVQAPAASKPPPAPQLVSKTDVKKVKDHLDNKRYKKARVLCEGILRENKGNRDAMRILGDIDFRNRKWESAVGIYRKVVGSWGTDGGDTLLSDKITFARCLIKTREYDDAMGVLEGVADAMKAITRKVGQYSLDDVVISIAVCHKENGKLMESAAITEMIIKRDESHFEGLLNYADIAGRMGKHQDAVGILMRCIVMDQQNEDVKRMLGEEVGRKEGVENVKKNVPISPQTAPAYAFLATIVRDTGHVERNRDLLELAVSQCPDVIGYGLNYLHALELVGQMEEAWEFGKKFLGRLEGKARWGKFNLSEILAFARDKAVGGEGDLGKEVTGRVVFHEETSKMKSHVVVDGEKPEEGLLVKTGGVTFDESELDLLAFLYTLVKILYNCGNTAALPDLIKLLEPPRLAAGEIHKTTIRNENAYFSCISQCLAVEEGGEGGADGGDTNPIYVCGDSHSMSPAWRTVGGRKLVPKLVTGLKHWHLRKESNFYPKASFHRVVKGIPKGSDVIFIFGEIDCREGLVLAVEKDRYKDLEEGMKTCISIWVEEAGKVCKDGGLRALIHPIVPVLNETRSIVSKYNRLLKKAVEERGGACGMVWLDIFESLVEVNAGDISGLGLKKGLALDGTHLHPRYLVAVEQWLRGNK